MIEERWLRASSKDWEQLVAEAKRYYAEAETNTDKPYGLGSPAPQKLGPKEDGAN